MTEVDAAENDFDLQPDPRILPMLGEINLLQWRCLAELVDNSVDGFLQALRQGEAIDDPEVHIALPTRNAESAKVTVRDNGPGMDPATLEQAVRAGWSGNSPIESLGMFGMGFNIATARLGTVTSVWTAKKEDREWHGLQIDFDSLRRQRHFKTPHLHRPKVDPHEHGTEVTVERLKPEQRQWLSKTANRSRVSRELSRTYSAMLRPNGVPISFALTVNGNRVVAKNHCVWDEDRAVQTTRHGTVAPVQNIDVRLEDRLFCLNCWSWVPPGESECLGCGAEGEVVNRQRRVRGWLGIQRYLNQTEFGVDLIRQGRKIEIANKDLFVWRDEDGEEPEYPIDDPRGRGRIVGEIHMDHCRVPYTKDRFDRNDPAWEEMVRIVRGEGPLRPDKARELGFGQNSSPLFLLFQAFRRSSPKPKVAGCWAKLLVVKDNERAEQMAKKFHSGDGDYQDDSKWWELVEEEDRKLLVADDGGAEDPGTTEEDGFGDQGEEDEAGEDEVGEPPAPERDAIPSLTREYRHDPTNLRWEVSAWSAVELDPELESSDQLPWRLRASAAGPYDFVVNEGHEVFRSATFTPLDALLAELAWAGMDFLRQDAGGVSFASILCDLRERYGGTMKLDPVTLSGEAALALSDMAQRLSENIDAEDGRALFSELSPTEQEAVLSRMATKGVADPQIAISSGTFVEHAPRKVLLEIFSRHPDLFFDGRYWDAAYADLDYELPAATETAQLNLVRRYESLLLDVIWLADQDASDLAAAGRPRLLRAALALELLEPGEPS